MIRTFKISLSYFQAHNIVNCHRHAATTSPEHSHLITGMPALRPPSPISLTPQPLASTSLAFVSINLFFSIPHIHEIIQHLSFPVWLISLSIMLSRSIDVATNGRTSFYLMAESFPLDSDTYIPSIICPTSSLPPSVHGHLGASRS